VPGAAGGTRIEHIQPGKPQQSAHVERHNRTVRYAWRTRTLFDSIEQAQDKAPDWHGCTKPAKDSQNYGQKSPAPKADIA
jgi:putative transposase